MRKAELSRVEMESLRAYRELDDFAHVEGPIVDAQLLRYLGQECDFEGAELFFEMKEDFFAALFEGRDGDFDPVEPRIEIGPKGALLQTPSSADGLNVVFSGKFAVEGKDRERLFLDGTPEDELIRKLGAAS